MGLRLLNANISSCATKGFDFGDRWRSFHSDFLIYLYTDSSLVKRLVFSHVVYSICEKKDSCASEFNVKSEENGHGTL